MAPFLFLFFLCNKTYICARSRHSCKKYPRTFFVQAILAYALPNKKLGGKAMLASIISVFSSFIHLILGISTPQSFPPPLPTDEENALFVKAEKGDGEARKKIILHNLRLVSHIVRKYYASAKNQEDLVSIGTIGLIKAVDTFKVSNGARFATYAARCIQNAILS